MKRRKLEDLSLSNQLTCNLYLLHDVQEVNRTAAGLERRLKERAARRKLEDLSIGPILSWTTERMLSHVEAVLKIPGMIHPCIKPTLSSYLLGASASTSYCNKPCSACSTTWMLSSRSQVRKF